jgi:tetratricopeptide (TPR) repeat protein
LLLLLLTTPVFAQTRLASDFEIAQMEKQLARSHDFLAQLSGRLNLGDLRAARNEPSLARAEFAKALDVATRERLDARRDSDITRYATATSYAALAEAKLRHEREAFTLAEEAVRYSSGNAKTWNLYATAMTTLGRSGKAIRAARNAVAIAERGPAEPLDLAVYRYSLASALDDSDESERLLVAVTTTLRSNAFARLRDDVARSESFEIYSTARGDAAAYLSLLNRSQLRLGALYERRGDRARAREQFERVIASRSDDATALAALARLAKNDDERARRYAEAFDANPFSMALIREYRKDLPNGTIDDSTTGGKVRVALAQLARGEKRAARETLDALLVKFPANATLLALRRETESTFAMPSSDPTAAELRTLIDAFESLTPDQRAALDAKTYASRVLFDSATASNGQTIFETGTIAGVPFRFSEPIAFTGTFEASQPLRLTYRILGVGTANALLLEPVRLEGR